uniref:Cysteine rich repeat-containing domain protein n=2 Tax=Caenorhabditis japonica TaxID=281687 RepID=A0A8R1I9Z0_CAEJA
MNQDNVQGSGVRDKRQSCGCAPAVKPSCACQRTTYTQPQQYSCSCQDTAPVQKSCPCAQPVLQKIYQIQTTQCEPACQQSCQQECQAAPFVSQCQSTCQQS